MFPWRGQTALITLMKVFFTLQLSILSDKNYKPFLSHSQFHKILSVATSEVQINIQEKYFFENIFSGELPNAVGVGRSTELNTN